MSSNQTAEGLADQRLLLIRDLETLHRLIVRHDAPLDEGSIRAASPILRRWITEGVLAKLTHDLGCSVTLPALNNDAVVRALPGAPEVDYFLTGGVRFSGVSVSGTYRSSAPYRGVVPIPIDRMDFEQMRLGAFTRQKRLYFAGQFFTCEEIIKFVANRLGGVHLDARRDGRSELLEAAAGAVTFGGPESKLIRGRLGQTHLVVEPQAVEPLNGLHVEIVSAAASLICVEFNGKPLADITTVQPLRSRIADYLGMRREAFRKSLSIVERDQ